MNKLYYIGHFIKGFNDGGQSRNKAFERAFFEKKASMFTFCYSGTFMRLFFGLKVFLFMLFSKNNKIFIHQGTLLVLFPIPIVKYKWIRKHIFNFIQNMINRNEVTIEVNDLPYEQSKDLELLVRKGDNDFQQSLYSLKRAHYVFASHEMGKYVNEKYNVNYDVVINGADVLKDFSNFVEGLPACFEISEIKFIYAGGLNKGRQIESLISKFRDRNEILILIGEWGEWLLDFNLSKNIFYLGNFEEDYAHYLTSKCDIGLIPYDEKRFYYNICYPTKASFYITAGIPFLSTPLLELKNVFEETEMAYFVSFNEWNDFIDNFEKSSLIETKRKIDYGKYCFYWEYLISKSLIVKSLGRS